MSVNLAADEEVPWSRSSHFCSNECQRCHIHGDFTMRQHLKPHKVIARDLKHISVVQIGKQTKTVQEMTRNHVAAHCWGDAVEHFQEKQN